MSDETAFVLGWNMSGYMPEMEPYIIAGADAAKRAMIDELERHADHSDAGDDPDTANDLSALAEDLNLSDVSSGWDGTAGNLSYWITLHGR